MLDQTSSNEARSEVLGVARHGGANFIGAVFNQVLRFSITFMLARLLGKTETGLYYQAFAFLALLGLVGSLGFTVTLTRFVAVHRADSDEASLRGTIRLGLIAPTLATTAMAGVLYAAAPWFAFSVFHDSRLIDVLRFVAVALPATVYTDVALSATQGFKTMRPYFLVNLIFEPSCRAILTILFLWADLGLPGVMTALVVTNWSSAVLASIALRRLTGPSQVAPRHAIRDIFTFSIVSWFSNLTSSGLTWADTIMLGIYHSAADVGIYQVATRLVLLGTIFVQPVTTSFAPRVADLTRRRRYDLLRKTYVLITSWMFRLALPSFVLLLIFPKELLAVFGRGFTAGATVTVLLTLGQVVNSTTGPGGYFLLMSGRPRVQMLNNFGALLLNIALNLWLLPRYGIIGAAISWSAAIIIFNIVRVFEVWSYSGMLPYSRDLIKGIIAGGAAALGGIVVRQLMDGLPALTVGVLVIGSIYIATTAAMGIDPDDRMVLKMLRRRLRPRSA